MLVVTRRSDEAIVIGDGIEVRVLRIGKAAGPVLADEIAQHGIAPRQGAPRLAVIDHHPDTIARHACVFSLHRP